MFAVNAGDPGDGEVLQRKEIRARLYPKYVRRCTEEGLKPVSKDCFSVFMKDGFVDTTVVDTSCSAA